MKGGWDTGTTGSLRSNYLGPKCEKGKQNLRNKVNQKNICLP